MSVEMKDLVPEDLDALASMQLASLEVHKTPTTDFDVAIKSYVDGKFSDATAAATQAVTDLIAGAPAQLDTLKEIADALNNDANLASALTTQISANTTANTAEAVSRASADVVLDGKISDEKSRAEGAENLLSIHIQEEVLSRENAVSFEAKERSDFNIVLDQKISDEKTRAEGAEYGLSTQLQEEVGMLQNAVSTEAKSRADADVAIDAKIADETFQRNVALGMEHDFVTNAVSGLDQKVSDEKTRAEGAEYGLSTQLQEETSARQGDIQNLSMNKMDKSPYYSGGSESHLKISEGSYLYLGECWRVYANNVGSKKRLEFQYASTGLDEDFKVAIPFIRG